MTGTPVFVEFGFLARPNTKDLVIWSAFGQTVRFSGKLPVNRIMPVLLLRKLPVCKFAPTKSWYALLALFRKRQESDDAIDSVGGVHVEVGSEEVQQAAKRGVVESDQSDQSLIIS